MWVEALTLQLGYNATLVAVGAALLGIAAGATGTFLFLRKRALVSDAISHATLPGVGIAFLVMASFGGDGRHLAGLLLGAALSSALGVAFMLWLSRRTRLNEDAAIGATLSVFFGFGVVLLTVIQTVSIGRPAGLNDFLLGMTAGMLYQDAVLIATAVALAIAAVWVLRRPMTMVAFDSGFASASGTNVRHVDLAITGLVLAVTIIGLKIVGLILIVALLIIPPVAARFWSDRVDHVLLISAAIGGAAGYLGATLSAVAPALPTGPIIVLVAFGLFVVSLLFSPVRGVFSVWLRHRRQQRRIHLRQGLLAIAQDVPIYEQYTVALLVRAGLMRADGVPTEEGRRLAAKACRDEDRWAVARNMHAHEAVVSRYDGLHPLESLLTVDEIAEIDRQLAVKGEGCG